MKIGFTGFVLLVSLFLASTGISQNLLYLHSNTNKNLYLVNLDDCSSTLVGVMPEIMYDIAMSPTGQLYGISGSQKLYLIDKSQATGVLIKAIPGYTLNALVYGADNFLYGADGGSNILKIDPQNGSFMNLGKCGYASGGDLTFYDGALYLAGSAGELVQINLNQPSASKLIGQMNAPNILGLITVGTNDCQGAKPKIYATSNNKLYEVDLATANVTLKCTLSVYSIGGAASLAEASKFQSKHAGKDSTLTVCFGATNLIDLFSYLRGNDQGGIWEDLDNSSGLSVNTLTTKSLKAGRYRFQYAVGDGLCADTALVTLTIPVPVKVDKLQLKSPGCTAENGEIVVTTTTTSETVLYALNAQPFQSDNRFRNLSSGSYKITLQTQTGCQTDSSVLLTPSIIPQISITRQDPKCMNETGQIEIATTGGSSPFLYSINGTDFQNQPLFRNLSDGNYTATVKDANSCVATQPVTLRFVAGPKILTIDAKPTTCGLPNGNLTIRAIEGSGALQYSVDGVTYQSGSQFSGLGAGIYQPTVKDAAGCTMAGNQRTEIAVSVTPKISVQVERTSCGESNGKLFITATGTGSLKYALNSAPFQVKSVFENLSSGTYQVAVEDSLNCLVNDSIVVDENCVESVYLPSAFTPNEDGSNDTWTVYFPHRSLKINSLTIFNRWGEVIHFLQNIDVQNGYSLWNGKNKEFMVAGGVFSYRLDVQFQAAHNRIYTGTVQVIH